jgi:type I restriction enzyme S subunit
VLAAAVSGKLTEEWRQQNFLHPDILKLTSIKKPLLKEKIIKKDLEIKSATPWFEIPDIWGFFELSSFALKITDGEHQTPKRENKGQYLLSARNVRDGFIDLNNVDYVGNEEFEKLRLRCNPDKNDILISCSGSVGRVSLVDESNKYVMVRSAALVKTIEDVINNKYLMYALQSIYLQVQIEEKSKSTAQSNLFLGQIKELGIPYPHIYHRQLKIRFSYFDDSKIIGHQAA